MRKTWFNLLLLTVTAASFQGCITMRVLFTPQKQFDPLDNRIDLFCIAGDIMGTAIPGTYGTYRNYMINDSSRSDFQNRYESGLIGFGISVAFIFCDYYFARLVSPKTFSRYEWEKGAHGRYPSND